MLTIREAQLEAFRAESSRTFRLRLIAHVRENYPEVYAEWNDAGTASFIDRLVSKARTNRVDAEGAVIILLELMLEYGEEFQRSPEREWARNLLAHRSLPAHIKMEAIRDRFADRADGRRLVAFRPPK